MIIRLSIVVLATIVFMTCHAQKPSVTAGEIEKAHRSFFDIILHEDYRRLDALLDDSVTLGFPLGGFSTKQEYVDGLSSGRLLYDSSANHIYHIRVFGSVGVVNGTGALTFRYQSDDAHWHKMLEHLSYTAIYVKSAGRVKMVAWQSNRLKSDQDEDVR